LISLLVAILLAACTTSHQVLTTFFDGVPEPGQPGPSHEVNKAPRRVAYVKPPPLTKFVEYPDLPPPTDWRGIYTTLEKNKAGDIDWARAIADKIITPKPSLKPDAKDEEPTDMDLEFVPKGQPEYKVVFPHKPHTQWLACDACHAGLFEMEKGKAAMTMDKLNAGEYCGVCHGKVASPELTNCPACHKAM
jgi:c(7)-type cytochrome triheme protein